MVTETITNKSSIMADETTAEETLHSNSPSKVNPISVTEDSIEISTRAYVKMVLHVAKYPHSFVNGVLLAKMPPKGQKPGNNTNNSNSPNNVVLMRRSSSVPCGQVSNQSDRGSTSSSDSGFSAGSRSPPGNQNKA